MKYQRREGTADGNDKYSIANQGGRRDDNNDNDHDCDNGEEIDDEKYSKQYLEVHNDNDNEDECDNDIDKFLIKVSGRKYFL